MPQGPFPKRAIHLDFHTMPEAYDVGADFDGEEFARTLKEAHVDYITAFARCNIGFAYYPTKIGTVHPSLKIDLFGQMVEACHKEGIRVAGYFNAGIDHEHALRHRDWCKINERGQVYDTEQMGHLFRNMCLNTEYRKHLLGMIDEVLASYPIDGLFLDCFDLSPCYGVECVEGMRAKGMDPCDDKQARDYCRTVTYSLLDEVEAHVRQADKDIYLCYNCISYKRQPTHMELEILPTAGWGYDYLPAIIRYTRTLGRPCFMMTGRFHKDWGDMGGIRTEHSLLFDCYNSIANGGTCSVGDHLHPRGKLNPEVYRLIESVYSKTKELDTWTDGAVPCTEIVVIDTNIQDVPEWLDTVNILPLTPNVQGAARMLSELKCQFDVSDGDTDLSKYKVIILPDTIQLSDDLGNKLQQCLAGGGTIISSAFAGLNAERTAFALDAYALSYEGPEPYDYSFVKALPSIGKDVPDMPITVYDPGIAMRAGEGTEVLARLHKPYFNVREWDWLHQNMYIPPDKDSGRPALACCNNVFHFSFPIFSGYFNHAVIPYKTLVRNCLEKALPTPIVRVQNMPSFGQVTVTQNTKGVMVHLLAYVPELRGKTPMIEEPISASKVGLRLRTNGKRAKRVYLAPSEEALDFVMEGGYVGVTIPQVNGYQLVVFELD